MDDHVELLVTVVLAAETDQAARSACGQLKWQVDGLIVASADCSAEEPGCWSVTMRVPSEERATHNIAAPLARAVRQFVRGLGPDFGTPRVSCEPPTAWTVLDDPEVVATLVDGGERILVEAWYGDDPYPDDEPEPGSARSEQPPSAESPKRAVADEVGCRLTLRVDVATSRSAGAEWQARALASRISRDATLTGITEHEGVCSVLVDLGTAPTPPPQTVQAAAGALDRPGWSAVRWEGETAITTWTAQPRPQTGITELELSSSPDARRRRG